MQFELFPPAPPDKDVSFLVGLLETRSRWLTAAEVSRIVHDHTGADWPDRLIRQLAQASDGQIISGQRGYKHIDHATLEEATHAAAWLESQARQMADRACAIRRRLHRITA
jgi:hypothetical protein